MTPDEEMSLYVTNRKAWLEYVAPRMATMITENSDAWANETWAMLPDDYRRVVWGFMTPPQRDRIKDRKSVV